MDFSWNTILFAFKRFKEGDLKSRINIKKGGELTELASTFNDMATTIEDNIEELKGVEKLRRELIESTSHDLRTPIASIHGYVETMMMNKDNISFDEKEKYMKVIMSNTDRLKGLVDDLFELSRFIG